jgi:hypothetical protein
MAILVAIWQAVNVLSFELTLTVDTTSETAPFGVRWLATAFDPWNLIKLSKSAQN